MQKCGIETRGYFLIITDG